MRGRRLRRRLETVNLFSRTGTMATANQPPGIRATGEDGSSLLGLGYASSSTVSDANNLDDMMKHYWQQCLEYHEQQEASEDQVGSIIPEAGVVFVASRNEAGGNYQGKIAEESGPSMDSPSQSQNGSHSLGFDQMDESELEIKAAEAAMKAKEIIKGFYPVKHDSEANNAVADAVSRAEAIIRKFDSISPEIEHPPNYYLAQRRQFYVKERQRVEKALLKNFSYIAQREEHRLEEKLMQIQESRELEETLQQRQEAKLKLKIQQQQNSQAGIGTKTRKKQEKMQNDQQKIQKAEPSASIYLSNLPCREKDLTAVIRSLFESYGTIRKIHLYRNKETGELKGDALVVYELDKSGISSDNFVQSICQQLNGCELPCGTILNAEPAISNRSNADKGQYGPSLATDTACSISEISKKADEDQTKTKVLESKKTDLSFTKQGGKGEDLDDFFASLV